MATLPSDDRAALPLKTMSDSPSVEKLEPEVLSPVDRVSEMLFGLLMALTFTGAVSVAESGNAAIRTMFIAALGCNLAWGLVDAVMYLVRTVTERGRLITLVRAVQGARDEQAGRGVVAESLSRVASGLVSAVEIEAIRTRVLAVRTLPARPHIGGRDILIAFQIFLIVVISTFPVVVPFLVLHDVTLAQNVSRAVALAMLFLGGLGLGRYAGYGSWRVGFIMAALGTALILAINALGG
jgi:hypothetical protein